MRLENVDKDVPNKLSVVHSQQNDNDEVANETPVKVILYLSAEVPIKIALEVNVNGPLHKPLASNSNISQFQIGQLVESFSLNIVLRLMIDPE